ncbi:phospholipase D-like domain-containing protein [Elusimicrobiota bacterium]
MFRLLLSFAVLLAGTPGLSAAPLALVTPRAAGIGHGSGMTGAALSAAGDPFSAPSLGRPGTWAGLSSRLPGLSLPTPASFASAASLSAVLGPAVSPVMEVRGREAPGAVVPGPAGLSRPRLSPRTAGGSQAAAKAAPVVVRPLLKALGSKHVPAALRRLYSGIRAPEGGVVEVAGRAPRTSLRGIKPARSRLKPAASRKAEPVLVPKQAPSHDYARMFDLTRRVLARPAARKFLKEVFKDELEVSEEVQAEYGLPDRIKEISESQLMLLLQYNADHFDLIEGYLEEMPAVSEIDKQDVGYKELKKKWRTTFRQLLEHDGMIEIFKTLNDPLRPMYLRTADGSPGYRNVEIHADHPSIRDGVETPGVDLKQVIIDFVEGAQKELMFNVYEFSLMDIAEALIRKADEGVKITGGIDKKEIHHQPGIKAVFDRLSAHKNITMVEVDSVGLNHQKLVIRDWSEEKLAGALFSSGNFTQSGIGPEGDLVDIPEAERPDYSIPNANHIITMDSYLAAQVAANNLIKTLEFGMRGKEYPLGGGFKVFGEKRPGDVEEPYMVLTFSPKGGLGKLNRDAIRRILSISRGPIRMLQFVISSLTVYEALVERARAEIEEGGKFDFGSVGDTPFALRPWSVFLALSGLLLDEEGELKEYVPMKDNPLVKILGKAAYKRFLRDVRIAPPEYGTNYFKSEGRKTIRVSGILHHKVLVSGEWVLSGSFNFTDSAESNNEHMIVFKDPVMAGEMTAIHDGLFQRSGTSVADEAKARNKREVEKAEEAKAKKKKKKRSRSTRADRRGRESEEGEKEARKSRRSR